MGQVLVTGATGFIGRHMMSRLRELGQAAVPCARSLGHDLCEPDAFERLAGEELDRVVHLAGATFVPDSWRDPRSFYAVNTAGTQRVLDLCRATSASLVYVSAYIYGRPRYLPIDEAHPVSPNNPYAHSKWLAEELCRFYARHYGVRVTILRPFNLFGRGQDDRFLIPSILGQVRTGSVIVQDDTPRRDVLHVNDFIDACLLALDDLARRAPIDAEPRIFNVGSGSSLSVRELVETIIAGAGGGVTWSSLGNARREEIPDTVADCRAIRAALGWAPTRPFSASVVRELLPRPRATATGQRRVVVAGVQL